MPFVRLLLILLIAAMSATLAPAREFLPEIGISAVRPALTPRALVRFCTTNPQECRADGPSEVALTQELEALLGEVNVAINKAIRPLTEKRDVWTLNPAAGDCEDYVLSKRSALIGQGVSASALRIAFTYTRRGVPHAVLVVRTNEGDLVLDNLSNGVKSLAGSGYRIRSMSSADPIRWTTG